MAMFSKKSEPRVELEPARRAPEASPPPIPAAASVRTYGIGDAIHLMRSLPVDENVDLVVQVIRATLASMNVRVQDIIEDANRKLRATEAEITGLHGKVTELERELESRRQDIVGLEADLQETTAVQERLQLAETIATVLPSPSPPSPPLSPAEPSANGQFGSYTHQP
jgi:hypothetical protein